MERLTYISNAVTEHTGITLDQMLQETREQEIKESRQLFLWACEKLIPYRDVLRKDLGLQVSRRNIADHVGLSGCACYHSRTFIDTLREVETPMLIMSSKILITAEKNLINTMSKCDKATISGLGVIKSK